MSRDCPAPEPLDLVATVRQGEWAGWVREQLEELPCGRLPDGTSLQWLWCSRARMMESVVRGNRLYIVSEGRLRCRAEIYRTYRGADGWICCLRRGDLEPVTIDNNVRGFRGLRKRFWPLEIERPCPDWQGAALGLGPGEEA